MADRLRPDQDEIDFDDEEFEEIPGALADEEDTLDFEDDE